MCFFILPCVNVSASLCVFCELFKVFLKSLVVQTACISTQDPSLYNFQTDCACNDGLLLVLLIMNEKRKKYCYILLCLFSGL